MDSIPNDGFVNWFNSANAQSENPDYAMNFPQPLVPPAQYYTQNFVDSSGFSSRYQKPSSAKFVPTHTKAFASVVPQVRGDGPGDDDEEDEVNNEDEENRAKRLSWTEDDDIRLVRVIFLINACCFYLMNIFPYSCHLDVG